MYIVHRDMHALLTARKSPAIKPVLAIAFGRVSMIWPTCSCNKWCEQRPQFAAMLCSLFLLHCLLLGSRDVHMTYL